MPDIKLTNVTKRWGKFYAVDNLNLDIEDNSFVTLLGPSGCGKTTTLRMIAGLETPTSGRITIGDKVVFDSDQGINVPPNKRRVGFLFQNYALWPNMTVYENIAFGLSNIKEELPSYDFSYKNTIKLIEILNNDKEVVKYIEECADKNSKIDVNKVIIKFIDVYSISASTAKTLFGYKLHEVKDSRTAAKQIADELAKKANEIREGYRKRGQELNEACAVTEQGKVIKTVRNLTKEEIDLSVRRVAKIVKIGMFMDRYPAELSGGQQQRVAIARTLAPEPAVLFMDEPLSNLDAKLRLEMRYELQRLHVETGSTFVYVTHDQMEAMTLATKICLINNGSLQQYAAPLEVYNKPNNLFVADFVGNPSINFIEAKGKQQEDGSIALSILDGINAAFVPSTVINLQKWLEQRDASEDEEIKNRQKALQDMKYVEKANKDEAFKYNITKVDNYELDMQEEKVVTDEDFVIGVRPECISITENG
ncbi:MAG: ABC transporter ATP-binding protein, partial [Clostridiaceae bacterium]|nr:ABC transporter ATP-binding protein [Clostridiaceae bacterium]